MGSCDPPASVFSVAEYQVLGSLLPSWAPSFALCVCLCVHTCGNQRLAFSVVQLELSTLFSETRFLISLELASLVILADQGPPEMYPLLLLPQHWDYNPFLFVLM